MTAAVAAIVSFGVTQKQRTWHAKVADASKAFERRPVDARLYGAFPYRPAPGRLRAAARPPADPTMLRLASVVAGANGDGDVRGQAAALLLLGRIDRATHLLDARLASDGAMLAERIERSTDVPLLSDLAVAHHARFEAERRAEDLMIATAAALRAYRLERTSPVAAWNRALCLSAVGLLGEARTAWRDYLQLETDPAWASEARQRLAELEIKPDAQEWAERLNALGPPERASAADITALAKRFPIEMKSLVERDWISNWAQAAIDRSATAPQLLLAIEAAGSGVEAAAHDRQLLDFAAAARSASDVIGFARPHVDLTRIQLVLRREGTDPAVVVAERCHAALLKVGSPSAATTSVNIGALLYHASRHERALEILDRADTEFDAKRWRLLAARAAWNRGVALTSLGDVTRADAALRRTMELYRGDPTHDGFLRMLLGDNAEFARNLDEAWPRYLDAVRLSERHGDPQRTLVILDAFARVALRNAHYGFAAILSETIAVRAAADPVLAPFVCHARTMQCEIENRIGDRSRADGLCRAARQVFSSITDAAVRDRLEGDLEIASAAVEQHASRIASLTRAVDVSTRRRDLFRLSRVLLLRAQAYVEGGARRLARDDLERALDAVEQQRARLADVRDKVTYFETARTIAMELVSLLVQSGNPVEALRIVDRVRARALIDRMSESSTAPLPIEAIRAALAPRQAVIEYWSGDRELYIWVIRGDAVVFARVNRTRHDLATEADDVIDALDDEGVVAKTTARLGADLIGPVAGWLQDIQTVAIVPDDSFAHVPFAALRGSDGRPFIATYAVHVAPSAAALILAQSLPSARGSVLVIANPAAASPLPLLQVRSEIAAASRALPHAVVHEAGDATVDVVRRIARDFDVLHFAAHGFAASASGEAALALAPGPGDADGLLTASDVERLTLRKGTLVVLAGCRTLRGRGTLDGQMSMARGFAAAGARSVIASTRDVGDRASSVLLTAFYASLAEGATPAAALRAAQLTMIRKRQPVSAWATYQLFGGQ